MPKVKDVARRAVERNLPRLLKPIMVSQVSHCRFLCRSHLTWNVLTSNGLPVAKFGAKQKLRTYKPWRPQPPSVPSDVSNLVAK
jgi:hypothetical protein